MTATPSPLSLKEHLKSQTEFAHRLLVRDLQALAADKSQTAPADKARSAVHIVAECALINRVFADFLRNGTMAPRPSPEAREAHLRTFDTADTALDYLRESTEALLNAIATLDESTLGVVSNEPFSRPATRFAVAEFPAVHMMYHDGQLNYIHTLHGDTEMHWG